MAALVRRLEERKRQAVDGKSGEKEKGESVDYFVYR